MPPKIRILLTCLSAFLLLTGCNPVPSADTKPLSETCVLAGEKCQHSAGKIGLCTPTRESNCVGSQCLHCVSQH